MHFALLSPLYLDWLHCLCGVVSRLSAWPTPAATVRATEPPIIAAQRQQLAAGPHLVATPSGLAGRICCAETWRRPWDRRHRGAAGRAAFSAICSGFLGFQGGKGVATGLPAC